MVYEKGLVSVNVSRIKLKFSIFNPFCAIFSVVLFLAISTFFEFLCIFLYAFVFAKLPIVKYYRAKAAREGSKTVASDLAAGGIQTEPNKVIFLLNLFTLIIYFVHFNAYSVFQSVSELIFSFFVYFQDDIDAKLPARLSNKELLFKNIDYALDLFLIYVLTLSIFPGFLYENTGKHQLGSWYPLVLIAMYNVWDLIARYLPLIKSIKIESRKGLMTAILSRFLFIPAFYFTAKYGDQGWMIMLISLLGLTNGYLTVCVMTVAPKGYTVSLNYIKITIVIFPLKEFGN